MSKAALYNETGGPEVLYVSEVEVTRPGPEQVTVSVEAAGINPYDDKVRSGFIPSRAEFPRRTGSDLAGTVTAVGSGAVYWDGSAVLIGDRVLGSGSGSVATEALANAQKLARMPAGLDPRVGAGLPVPGLTATAILDAVPVGEGDTVLVGGATGAVGMLVCQLALAQGARVIGTAGSRNFEFLQELGVTPVLYGPGLAERLAGLGPVTAIMDCHGREALDAGIALQVPKDRMVAIAAYDALEELGVKSAGYEVRTSENLELISTRVASGELVLPVVMEFPLDEVREAFEALRGPHAPGKIVVLP